MASTSPRACNQAATADGICISGAAYDHIRKVLPLNFVDLGMQSLKNIEPIRAYAVSVAAEPSQAARLADAQTPLALPDKPSIAVLPFTNMSGDPEQDYFADGMVDDIITALSHFKALFVIARNSSFTYKGRAVDVKQVGASLGCATCWKERSQSGKPRCASRDSSSIPPLGHIFGQTGLMVGSATSSICRIR
jgi:hypothetical protein